MGKKGHKKAEKGISHKRHKVTRKSFVTLCLLWLIPFSGYFCFKPPDARFDSIIRPRSDIRWPLRREQWRNDRPCLWLRRQRKRGPRKARGAPPGRGSGQR